MPATDFQINTTTAANQDTSSNSLAMNNAGEFVVVWASDSDSTLMTGDGSGRGIFARRYTIDPATGQPQALSPEFLVNATTLDNQQFPSVAIAKDNSSFVVTWTSTGQDGSGFGVYAQLYKVVDGVAVAQFATDLLVNTTTISSQQRSTVAMDGDGDFVITWEGAATGTDIYARRYTSEGVAPDPEFLVNTVTTGNQTAPVIAANADGDFVVAWVDANDGNGSGVFLRRYTAAGVVLGDPIRVNTYTPSAQDEPRIAMNSAGEFVVTWTSLGQDGSGRGIYGQRFSLAPADASNPSGVVFAGAEFRVNTVTDGEQQSSSVSVNQTGSFVIAWAGNGGATVDTSGAFARPYSADGVAQANPVRANVVTAGTQSVPSVGADPSGAFVVAWTSNNFGTSGQDGDSAGVFGRRIGSVNVTPSSGLVTTEAGGTATFSVVLNAQPTDSVTIGLSSSDTTEGTIATPSLIFTSANWNTPQSVVVTGQNDPSSDNNQPYTIQTTLTTTDALYEGINPTDVALTNIDDDIAGLLINPVSGLVTTEAGGTATFSVVLNTQPTAPVTVGLSSSDSSEGLSAASALVFNGADWNSSKFVTVTGVADAIDDGNQPYTILTTVTSGDAAYNNIDASDISLTNEDDDTAAISITPTSGTTTEAGGTATFAVALTSQPTADVTIALASSNPNEGTVAPAITFTPTDWNTPQTVTVTGINDNSDDGDQAYTIVTALSSSDLNYTALDVSDVSLLNIDDDTAEVSVSAISGDTSESGATATFTVKLASQPTTDVTIALSSSTPSEGVVLTANVIFTATNWSVDQTVTVQGVDDAAIDGNQLYSITSTVTAGDAAYNGKPVTAVNVTNIDNDIAGLTLSPISGTTTEAGGTASFTIKLNTQPSDTVTVNLNSSNLGEGTVTPSLVFDSVNWAIEQSVTVTGVDDFVADGNQPYSIATAISSSDPAYSSLAPLSVAVTNTDNDVAGITLSPISGNTTEAGSTATTTVTLNSQPTAAVTVSLSSSDISEGTVLNPSVVFNPVNWNVAQVVTVQGVDDLVVDGNQPYSIATAISSSDPTYSSLAPLSVSAINEDNDVAGLTIGTPSGNTTEAGGTATLAIALNSQPIDTVTVSLSSTDTSEGTVTPTLAFTPANWNTAQIVTLAGIDDFVVDGDQPYAIAATLSSSDAAYNGLTATSSSLLNIDNDVAAIALSPISGTTTEGGGTATLTVRLTSQPTDLVTIALSSSDATEGAILNPSLVFDAVSWNIDQIVTVQGQDDAAIDGSQSYTIASAATSNDLAYAGKTGAPISVTNLDNDTPGINITPLTGTTTEAGGTTTVTIALASQPTADVLITFTNSDATEGSLSTPSLTFTPVNWNSAQSLTITGVDDAIDDDNQPYTLSSTVSSPDTNYNNFSVGVVSLVNTDDDTAGITVSPISGDTTEPTGTATFAVVLTSQPIAPVTINLTSTDTTEGTVAPTLSFDTTNWASAQTVTVTGVDDLVADGSVTYTIQTTVTSSDTQYNAIDPTDVAVTNQDDEVNDPPVLVNALPDRIATEDLPFTFALPTNTFADPDPGDALTYSVSVLPAWLTFDPATLTFNGTPGNGDVGAIDIQVTVADLAGLSTSDTLTLTIANVNDAPTLTNPLANQTATEGSGFNFAIPSGSFIDIDAGDSLTYTATLTSGALLPSWLSFDGATQTFSGTPSDSDVGTLSLRITATDTAPAAISTTFDLAIANLNTPPSLVTPIADQTIAEDSALSISIPTTTFADADAGEVLTYSATLESGAPLPSWLSFDAATRTLSGTPTNAEVGSVALNITATDSAAQAVSDSFNLTITNVNDAPILVTAIADQTATLGNAFTLTLPTSTFSDSDSGDSLSYTAKLDSGAALPSWLNFDAATLTFSGTPTSGSVGTVSVQVTATDLSSTSASDVFSLTIAPIVNQPPIVATALPDQTANEGTPFSFTVSAASFTDPDAADILTYSTRQANGNALPSWLTFNSSTLTFSGTPFSSDVATLTIQVTASDPAFNQISDSFDLMVAGVNDSPIVIPSKGSFAYASSAGGVAIDPTLTLADPDSPTLAGATVKVVGFVAGEDSLALTNPFSPAITGSFAANTGTLTLTGVAPIDAYQTVLRSITYRNLAANSTSATRSIEFAVNDGTGNSLPKIIAVLFQNVAPVIDLNGSDAGVNFSTSGVMNTAIGIVDTDLTISDADGTAITAVYVVISNPIDGNTEQLLIDTTGTPITASYDAEEGALSLLGTASAGEYQQVLRTLRYRNQAIVPNATARKIVFVVSDGTSNSIAAETTVTLAAQPSSNPVGLVTTPQQDILNAPTSNDAIASVFAFLQQNDVINGGGGSDRFTLSDGVGSLTVDVGNLVNQVTSPGLGSTVVVNFEQFDLSGFSGTASLTGNDSLNDALTGGAGNDILNGKAGNDTLVGNGGNDSLDGGVGDDALQGGTGNDLYIVDSPGDQVLEDGDGGTDAIQASFNYTLGNAIEQLTLTGQAAIGRGNALNNTLIGNQAKNTLVGGTGNDRLQGEAGNDRLNGGTGRDTLIGGTGRDLLVGGSGRDGFLLTSANSADRDVIRDFKAREDVIQIAKTGFAGLGGNRLSASQFVIGSRALDRGDRFIYNDRTGGLFFDRDGSGGMAQVQIATLSKKPTLAATSFVLR